ncbi:MAG: right-handed parallel beta-helix repeat-containing protein, partial [Anaerolineae bacterium]|nr:right-handed parallel beta-helix repeat-containing protein [Anaerolineae bacterium]
MSHYSHKLWRALALALVLGLGLVALGTRNVSATINPLEIIGEVGVASIDPSASAGTWYLRYTGNPAPTGYSHAYQWAEPQIVCSPDDIPTTFDGTLDVTNMSNGDVAFIGLLDKGLMGTGSTGYQSGAYIYVYKQNATTLRIGPSDGNKNGEIIQIFQDVTIPVDNTLNVTLNINGAANPNSCASGAVGNGVGCITVTVENQTPMTDSYGDVKSLNNAVTYSHHEFEHGAYPGWDDYGTANIQYDLEVTGCSVIQTVRPADMSPTPLATDWHIAWIEGLPTYSIVPGPATPPLGTASLQMTTGGTADKVYIMNYDHAGVKLADITTLGYSTYGNSNLLAPVLQLQIDPDGAGSGVPKLGGGTTNFATVSFEPYFANTVTPGVWQTWDVLTGGASVWASNVAGDTGNGNNGTQNNPATWAEFVAFYPDATLSGGFGVNVGKGWTPPFTGHVDALQIGYGGNMVTYDFEPDLDPCTTVCYADAVNGNDANSGSYANDAKKTIQAAVNQVSAGGQVIVAQGVYSENVVIPKSLTLTGNGQQDNNPGTRLDGTSAAAGPGIFINTGVKNVKIENLRVKNYNKNSGQSAGIWANGGNDGLVVQNVTADNNGWAGYSTAGIYANGPVDNVLIDHVTATNNKTRGIVIWNGFKTNITITNNTVKSNNCCGIELQDGTASGVTVTGNTVESNTDSGMAFTGLMAGAGPNVIANNTVKNNGRFGIEIKLPNGTGAPSGDGSIVVENNTVSLTSTPADLRDYAGIAVFRRVYIAANNNVDIPTGVIVRNNTVSGYVQNNGGSNSTGFGIVVEGTNMTATGNTLNNNDVGVQAQAGHLPYTPNTNIDGDQSNLADDYFGRGNSPQTCANIGGNTFSGNGVDTRFVGNGAGGLVTNIDTGETFCTIQAAIDDSDTVNGHTIQVSPGIYPEQVTINKSIHLVGAGVGQSIIQAPATMPKSNNADSTIVKVTGATVNAEITGFTITGPGPSGCGSILSGIFVRDGATAEIHHNMVADIRDTGQSGCQNGRAIMVGNLGFTTSGTADIHDNTIVGYQKTGILVAYTGSYATVTDNIVQGAGKVGYIAMNGIDVGNGASADVTGNTVSGNWYTGATNWANAGIILYDGGASNIANNTVTENMLGVYIYDSPATVASNTITTTWAGGSSTMGFVGIRIDMSGSKPATAINVTGNQIIGDDSGYGRGIQAPLDTNLTITKNTIKKWKYGVWVRPCAGSCATPPSQSVVINRNSITDSGVYGINNGSSTSLIVNGTCNWWGDMSGPGPIGLGSGDKVSNDVDFGPWLRESNLNSYLVTNTDTTKVFCGIQQAIDDGDTDDGDTITVSGGWAYPYSELVDVYKSVHLIGDGAAT